MPKKTVSVPLYAENERGDAVSQGTPDFHQALRHEAVSELLRLKERYACIPEMAPVIKAIDRHMAAIKN